MARSRNKEPRIRIHLQLHKRFGPLRDELLVTLGADSAAEVFRRSLELHHALLTAVRARKARLVLIEPDGSQCEVILS